MQITNTTQGFPPQGRRRTGSPIAPAIGSEPSTLIGIREVMEILNVSKSHAHRIVWEDEFPNPYDGPEARIARGRIWKRVDIDAWALRNAVPEGTRPPSVGFQPIPVARSTGNHRWTFGPSVSRDVRLGPRRARTRAT